MVLFAVLAITRCKDVRSVVILVSVRNVLRTIFCYKYANPGT